MRALFWPSPGVVEVGVHHYPRVEGKPKGATPRVILRTFRDNECNHDYDGKTVHDRVISLDAGHMVLQMESDYLIRYERTP